MNLISGASLGSALSWAQIACLRQFGRRPTSCYQTTAAAIAVSRSCTQHMTAQAVRVSGRLELDSARHANWRPEANKARRLGRASRWGEYLHDTGARDCVHLGSAGARPPNDRRRIASQTDETGRRLSSALAGRPAIRRLRKAASLNNMCAVQGCSPGGCGQRQRGARARRGSWRLRRHFLIASSDRRAASCSSRRRPPPWGLMGCRRCRRRRQRRTFGQGSAAGWPEGPRAHPLAAGAHYNPSAGRSARAPVGDPLAGASADPWRAF